MNEIIKEYDHKTKGMTLPQRDETAVKPELP